MNWGMIVSKYKEKYPWLRLRNLYDGGHVYEEIDAVDDFPEGWFNAFGEMMLEELDQAIKKEPGLEEEFVVDQVKEKYGSLRFYVNYSNEEINNIIGKYEHISENVCIMCGKPDVPMMETGWISPYCFECFRKGSLYKNMSEEDARKEYDELKGDEGIIKDSYTYITYEHNKEGGYVKNGDGSYKDKRVTVSYKPTVDAIRIRYEERKKQLNSVEK